MGQLSLRGRLLASYVLLLAIALGIISGALILLLGTRPAPPQPTYQRLAIVAQGGIRDALEMPGRALSPDRAADTLKEIGTTYQVRILVADLSAGRVLFDSTETWSSNDSVLFHLEQSYRITAFEQAAQAMPRPPKVMFGDFNDPDGTEWLFTGVGNIRPGDEGRSLLFADVRPTTSLQDTLAEFGIALLGPLFQAAAIGLLVAFGLALLISRSIAQPLQAVARAATAVAEGHFDQYVPVKGPPEVRSVAEAFNLMSAEVRSTQLSQRDFMANVSHDLKTPLTSIQGYSQAIMDGAVDDPTQAANIIYDEAGRLNRMVIQLTDLARIQAGRLSMQTSAIDLGQMAAAIGQRLAVVAEKKGIALHIDTPSVPEIAGDGDRLVQVVTNLLSNAIKYTPSGGEVWLKTGIVKNGVEVSVKDTGIGIPQEDLPRVFERFYQVDKTRGPKRGTGLGLAITAEIVHAHGGRISVISPGRGRGSTFSVWLPSPQMSTIINLRR